MNKIYNPVLKLIFFFGIFIYASQSMAQVLSRDSLALVSLYNGTNGTQWVNHTNWLTANVSSWYGIKVSNGRVTKINLPLNNLSGGVTDSIANLDSLREADLSHNHLSYFPALTGAHLDSLSLQNNKLTFRDLLPNKAHVDSFYYAPQDSADVYVDTTVAEQASVSLSTLIDYNPSIGDNYQWFKGATPIVSSASNSYTILCMDSSQVGLYYCIITNPQLSRLSIYRRPINLRVKRLANPGADFHVCDSSSTLQGIVPPGGSIVWSRVSGASIIANDTNAITAISHLSIGANVFKYAVSAGNISCTAHTYSVAQIIVTRDTNPSPAYAGPDQSTCGPQAALNATPPSIGIGTWTVIRGSAAVSQPNTPQTAVNGLIFGQNIFRWQIVNGACAPAFFDEIIIYRDDTLRSINAGNDTSICPTSYVLSAILPINTNGVWSVSSGSGTFATVDSPQTPVSGLSEYVNTLKWTVSNTCNTLSASVNVNVYRFTVADAGPDVTLYYSPINAYTIADSVTVGTGGNGQYSYVWSPSTNIDSTNIAHPRFQTPDAGSYTYAVTVTDGHGCTASNQVTYTVIKKDYLTVPSLITPNGDGVNDALYIPGIESYPNNELIVADRNDQVVYRKKGYTNDWQGTNELGFSQQGQKLPADTYFYTLKLEEGKSLQTGFFLIKY